MRWMSNSIVPNGKRLCDGGFYAVQIFKTAIAKPVLCEVVLTNKLNNYENMEYRNASLKPTNQRITLG